VKDNEEVIRLLLKTIKTDNHRRNNPVLIPHSNKSQTFFLTRSQIFTRSKMFAFINNFIANHVFPIHYLEFHNATANFQERNILLELAAPYPAVEERLQNLFNVEKEVHQLKQRLEDLQKLSCLMLDDLCEEGFDHLTRNFWESR